MIRYKYHLVSLYIWQKAEENRKSRPWACSHGRIWTTTSFQNIIEVNMGQAKFNNIHDVHFPINICSKLFSQWFFTKGNFFSPTIWLYGIPHLLEITNWGCCCFLRSIFCCCSQTKIIKSKLEKVLNKGSIFE